MRNQRWQIEAKQSDDGTRVTIDALEYQTLLGMAMQEEAAAELLADQMNMSREQVNTLIANKMMLEGIGN